MAKKLIDHDPHTLIKAIAEFLHIYPLDKRGLVTLHGTNGMKWTGIPTSILNGDSGQSVLLKTEDSDRVCYVMLSQIVAVEIDNMKTLNAFLAKPWPQNPKYASLSKLQATREIESLGQTPNGTQFKFHLETLPAREDAFEDTVTWLTVLKSTLEKMSTDPTAKEAISQIQLFEAKFASGGMKVEKNGSTAMFQVDLSFECFNQRKIEELLSSIL